MANSGMLIVRELRMYLHSKAENDSEENPRDRDRKKEIEMTPQYNTSNIVLLMITAPHPCRHSPPHRNAKTQPSHPD